jgi:hypothetical protein
MMLSKVMSACKTLRVSEAASSLSAENLQGDVYYYGCDNLFTRHPEVIKRICVSAPSLLPTLLDGLVWRSRQTKEGGEMELERHTTS